MLSFSSSVAERLRLSGLRFVVTGAGGWLGRATLELLDAALGIEMEARVRAYASAAREVTLASGRRLHILPLTALRESVNAPAFVYHYAYLGKEKVAELGPERFKAVNREINERVASYCSSLESGAFFFASSGAAYFATGSGVDTDREPYGQSKIEDEIRFLGLDRPAFPVTACRIFNMTGPHINKVNTYALSSILNDVIAGRTISIRSAKPVFRSFVHVRDVIEVATSLLLDERHLRMPYDASSTRIVEVEELARLCAALLGRPDLPVTRPPLDESAFDRYVGDGAAFEGLAKGVGVGLVSLESQIIDTARYLKALS